MHKKEQTKSYLKVIWLVAFGCLLFIGTILWLNVSKPGTFLNGENISFKNKAEILAIIEKQSNQTLNIVFNDENVEINPETFGITTNIDKTLNNIISFPGKKKLVVDFDKEIFTKKFQELDKYNYNFINPAIVFDEETKQFDLTKGTSGKSINITKLKNDLIEKISSNENEPITVIFKDLQPEIPDDLAKKKTEEGNSILNKVIVLNSINSDIVINSDIIKNWISIGDDLEVSLNEDSITEWIEGIEETVNVNVQNGSRRVDNNQNVLRTEIENIDGHLMNKDEIKAKIIELLNGKNVEANVKIPYDVVPAVWDDKVVAVGAENFAYPALPGEKWIDINLSDHSVTAFEGTTAIMSSPMISAGSSYTNAVGEFSVYWKLPSQTMRGNNADGSTYVTENVPWILYYEGGYALHGAPWRESFGYDAGSDGSHGCINLPVSFANSLYNWANEGTIVVAHY